LVGAFTKKGIRNQRRCLLLCGIINYEAAYPPGHRIL